MMVEVETRRKLKKLQMEHGVKFMSAEFIV